MSAGLPEFHCPSPEICPLSQIRAGQTARVRQLTAPPDVSQRLRELGFCEEQRVRLLSQSCNLICQVCNARLAISHELAQAILVEPLSASLPPPKP